MLVITGPGRSGTSMLAQFCCMMGSNTGGEWCEEIDAGLEHPVVARINDAMYREARITGTVAKSLAEYRDAIAALDLKVVKDPRFTYHPAILRAWRSVRPDLTVLLTYRNPEMSIASRNRHKKFLFVKRKSRPEALKCDLADTVETLLDCGVPHEILLFPNLLKQYDVVYNAFHKLGMPIDREAGHEAWWALVDEGKVHFRGRAETEAVAAQSAAINPTTTIVPVFPTNKRPFAFCHRLMERSAALLARRT